MIRKAALMLVLILAGCADPEQFGMADTRMAEPAMAPEMAMPDECLPGDDGIGGTGCRVE